MLVKHNLSSIIAGKLLRKYWHSSGYYENEFEGDAFKFRNITNDYTVAAYGVHLNKDEGGDFVYMALENLGNNPISISIDNTIPSWYKSILSPNQKIIVSKKLSSLASLRVGPTENPRDWHILKCNAFALTNGATDIYLPHKDNLPKEKQPLLPPEGQYKEIQAL